MMMPKEKPAQYTDVTNL